jgi:precorrin-6B methylase 1
MTVYFIGAGPGAPDLITLRGQRLIERCLVCLYAGSLVPTEIVAAAPAGALVRDTAPMHLDEIVAEMAAAHARGEDVARVHSGDPSIYGAVAEQMRRLDALAIPYEVVPGVPAFAGAAARLATELTLPGISQTEPLSSFSPCGRRWIGASAPRRMRGLLPGPDRSSPRSDRATRSGVAPLIRRYAPPSPTRGEGTERSAHLVTHAHQRVGQLPRLLGAAQYKYFAQNDFPDNRPPATGNPRGPMHRLPSRPLHQPRPLLTGKSVLFQRPRHKSGSCGK